MKKSELPREVNSQENEANLLPKELLGDEEKLADYLDYLHVQRVKAQSSARISLAEAKQLLNLP